MKIIRSGPRARGGLTTTLIVGLAVASTPAEADVIIVPDDYPAIQTAVVAAGDGDEIVVRPGTYMELVDFLGKDIVVRSTDPDDPGVVATTIIDGNGAGTIVTLSRGVIRGFTLRNGFADDGSAVYATGAAQVLDNVITSNTGTGITSAVFADGDVVVDGNRVCGNTSVGVTARTRTIVSRNTIAGNGPWGGVTAEHNSLVRENVIIGNRRNRGAGIYATGNAAIRSNLIVANWGSSEGGGVHVDDHFGAITNNTIVANVSRDSPSGIRADRGLVAGNIVAFSPSTGDAIRGGALASIDYNCVFGNNGPNGETGPNDVVSDPLFLAGPTGTWTDDASFDSESFSTTITDAAASFVDDALVGAIINVDDQQTLRFGIIANTQTTITVIGDASELAETGDVYQIFDVHIANDSPCVDAGDPVGDLASYVGADVDGEERIQDCAIDIGADEVTGAPTTVLVIESTMTTSELDVSRPDCFGLRAGTGRFNRFYATAPFVTLTASELFDGLPFRWVVGGDQGPFGEFTTNVKLNDHVLARAEYFPVSNTTRGTFFVRIQDAISSFITSPGDEIVAYPSVYDERLDFLGKDIVVRSVDPLDPAIVESTILDGAQIGPVVTLSTGEISGFTIRNGGSTNTAAGVAADGTSRVTHNIIEGNSAWQSGAGVAAAGAALIADNIIRDNYGTQTGGGIAARDDAVVIRNRIHGNIDVSQEGGGASVQDRVLFCDNIVTNNQANLGGGIRARGEALVLRNTFTGNVATNRGGGLYVNGDTTVAGNTIRGNMQENPELGGGGIYIGARDLVIDNAIIGNTSLGPGGGIHMTFGADVIGNTIVDNSCVGDGGGIFVSNLHEQFTLLHNVVAFNGGNYGVYSAEPIAIDYSCVFGNAGGGYGGLALPGAHDLAVDPMLAPDRIHLLAGSPCINAGDPRFVGVDEQTDIDGDARVLDGRVDIGADEVDDCPADLDDSGNVDFADLIAVLAAWGPCDATCPEDLDGNDVVGFGDLLVVLSAWGACPG